MEHFNGAIAAEFIAAGHGAGAFSCGGPPEAALGPFQAAD